MTQWFDLKDLASKVHYILKHSPASRDDDRFLIVEVWAHESTADEVSGFFREMMQGNISFPDTITRVRRKLQEKHEALRGKKWKVRHGIQKAVCQQLDLLNI